MTRTDEDIHNTVLMDTSKKEAVLALINYFGSQKATGAALNVHQSTVSYWLKGTLPVNPIHAANAELETEGHVKASDLCPEIVNILRAS